MIALHKGLPALLCLLALTASTLGVETQTRRDEGMEGFAQGTLNGVSVNLEGWLRLAPELEDLARPDALFVWDLAMDSKGNIYAGTGNKGAVYRIDAGGRLSLFGSTGQVNVHSVAVDSKGNVYAGTAPDGLIYRFSPGGRPEVFCRTGSAYVWDLVVDETDHVLAAVGKEGAVLRLSPTGRRETLYKAEETHALCLHHDPENGILVGTSPSGHVLKLDGQGGAGMLLDAAEPDVWDIARDERGRFFAVTASGQPSEAQGKLSESAGSEGNQGDERKPGENSVYVIEPDKGRAVRALGLPHTSIFAAAHTPAGGLYIGTGDAGNILRVSAEYNLELLLDLPDRQVLCLLDAGEGELLVGTGNGGSILKISRRFRKEGEYLSSVLDSQWGAQWGKLTSTGKVREPGDVTFFTRSGNTSEPSAAWSEWLETEGPGPNQGKILTEGGRYLQYRARFATADGEASPIVESVAVSYLPNNLPPRIKEVKVHGGPGDAKQGENSGNPKPGRPSSTAKLTWTAEDPNGDLLSYSLRFQREGDMLWTVLIEDLDKPTYTWDTTSVPDGAYRVLVRATDEPANTLQSAGKDERLSSRLVIDNTRPRVQWLKGEEAGGRIKLTGAAYDETSNVVRIEYAVNEDDWRAIAPEDGIYDSPRETFSATTDPLPPNRYYVRVRVTDEKGNTRVERVLVGVSSVSAPEE